MESAIVKGVEMGTHTIPIAFDSPLCWIFWICLLVGFGIQSLLQRKRNLRFLWPGLLLVGVLGCEAACQIITGWDLILWVILHFYLLTMLIGTLVGIVLRHVRKK